MGLPKLRAVRTPPALPACRCELAHGSDMMPPSLARGTVVGRPRREAHSIVTHAARVLREDSPTGMQSADEQVALRSWHTTLVRAIKRHLDAHDPDRASLQSAARAALVIPPVFAFADNVIGNPQTTIFSVFGSFSLLVLADFQGTPRRRLTAYLALAALLQAELDGSASLQARIDEADDAVGELRRRFVATPFRPTGTTGSAEALAFLVDELDWLRVIVVRRAHAAGDICPGENCETVAAAISVLRASAARLEGSDVRPDLERVLVARAGGIKALLRNIRHVPAGDNHAAIESALEPSFRAHQLSYAAWEVAANALFASGASPPGIEAERRSLPPGPRGVARLLAEQARARGVWFQNSVRGAAGLTIAVYVAH